MKTRWSELQQLTLSVGLALGASLGAMAQPACSLLSTNAVAWWPAEDHAYDIVGGRFAVIQGGVEYAAGKVGRAFSFDGTQKRVRILESTAADLSRLPRWTIEAWVRPASFANAAYPTIFSEGNRIITLGLNNGTGKLESWVNNDSTRRLLSTNALTLNDWNHVALVYEGGRRLLYLNGVLDGSTNTPPITDDSSGASIGQTTVNDATTLFGGLIDELSLYNTALTVGEISDIYNAGVSGKCFNESSTPAFVLDPVSQDGFLGGQVTLTALAAGPPVIGYQWLFNSNAIAGATGYALTLTNLNSGHEGFYSLRATNSYGSSTSAVAHVTVPFCTDAPTNNIAWWPADGSAVDPVNRHDGAMWGGTTFGPGVAGGAFCFNGTNGYVSVPDAPELSSHSTGNGEMSVEAWVKLDQLPQSDAATGQNRRTVLAKASPGQWEYGLSITAAGIPEFFVWNLNGATNSMVSGGQILTGRWHHIVATFKRSDAVRLYQDGQLVGTSTAFSGLTGNGSSPLYIGRRGDAQFLKGWVDEAALYSRALHAGEVTALYAADGPGKCSGASGPAPHFVRQPENQTGYLLLGAGLTAFANGTPRPTYQWYKSNETSWVTMPGQTNGSLVLTNLSQNVVGHYRVVATNQRGLTTSESAYLRVVPHDILTGGDIFEKGWNGWTTDGSIWETGRPTSGPGAAHSGSSVLATVLGGNYPRYADSRAISPPLVVPSASDNPRLRFWHWFATWGGDKGFVEVREVGSTAWVKISSDYDQTSGAWTYALLDLRAYAGKVIQFAFRFQDDGGDTGCCNYTPTLSSGWYIDDVVVLTGPYEESTSTIPKSFETGLGDWAAERGVWETGRPTSGPGAAHSGSSVLATVLGGNYPRYADSRAISPPLVVPSASDNPRLRFWHWFATWGGDKGFVEVREVGSTAWVKISSDYDQTSGAWTYALLDLRAYAGKVIQFAFRFQDDGGDTGCCNYTPTLSSGWYIDDVVVLTGPYEESTSTIPKSFETGLGDWAAERGVWETGRPTSGPGAAHSGSSVLATVLGGNYPRYADSRAISPPLVVPSASDNPRLRFWHWFATWGGDKGFVEVREVGSTAWVKISSDYDQTSGAWTYALLDLRAYAGKVIQFAFRFQDDGGDTGCCNYTPTLSSGWYIDDVVVLTGPYEESTSTIPKSFETGLGDWAAERGVWETGRPTSGPGAAHSGSSVLATVLGGNYPRYADSRAISPPLVVPSASDNPRLRFWHWFATWGGDKGFVEVREVGASVWTKISPDYSETSLGWSEASLDLRAYGGRTIQIAFRFQDDGGDTGCCNYTPTLSQGWYVDDIYIQRGNLAVASITSKTVNEDRLLSFPVTVIAAKPDSCVSYQLIDPPAGATIDPTTGVFSWTPEECQGPGIYNIPIYVVDFCNNEANNLSFVKVTVNEVNERPWLFAAESTAYVGQTNFIALCSGDADCPRNPLSYSLLGPVPSGLTMDTNTGSIRWRPTLAQAGNHNLLVRLCDGGSPNLCVTNSLAVGVTTNAYWLDIQNGEDNRVRFSIHQGSLAVDYILQQATELCGCPCETVWEDVGRISPTEMPYVFDRQMDRGNRFFRLRETPRTP